MCIRDSTECEYRFTLFQLYQSLRIHRQGCHFFAERAGTRGADGGGEGASLQGAGKSFVMNQESKIKD